MNKKVLVIIGIVMMVLFLGLLVLNISLPEKKEAAVIEIPELTEIDPYLRIRNGFDKLKAGLDEMERQSPKSAPLVQGNGISIDKKSVSVLQIQCSFNGQLAGRADWRP